MLSLGGVFHTGVHAAAAVRGIEAVGAAAAVLVTVGAIAAAPVTDPGGAVDRKSRGTEGMRPRTYCKELLRVLNHVCAWLQMCVVLL